MWIDKEFFSVRGFKWILWMLVIYFTQMRSICILFLYFCKNNEWGIMITMNYIALWDQYKINIYYPTSILNRNNIVSWSHIFE